MLAVGTTGAVYYLVVLLLFYRRDAKRLLARKTIRTNLQANRPNPPQVSIMGATSTEEAPLLSEAAAIQVAPAQVIAPGPDDAVLQVVQEEMNPLLQVAAEANTPKAEFLSLLRLITAKHAPLTKAHHREAINNFLLEECKEKLPFEVHFSDLHTLWPADPSGF